MTSAERLALTRQAFRASTAELAFALGTTRAIAYTWLRGDLQPDAMAAQRIEDLELAIRLLRKAGVVSSLETRRIIKGGKNLLGMVAAGCSAKLAAEQLIHILQREAEQRRRLALRLAGREAGPLNIEDLGIPHLAEET